MSKKCGQICGIFSFSFIPAPSERNYLLSFSPNLALVNFLLDILNINEVSFNLGMKKVRKIIAYLH